MNQNKPRLWSGVSSEGGHQKSVENDSWSSSWSGPLIRSEWQENMGPKRSLPPAPAPSLLLPFGHLQIPHQQEVWLLSFLLKGEHQNPRGMFHMKSCISFISYSYVYSAPPKYLHALHVWLHSSTRCHKPVWSAFTMTTLELGLPTTPSLMDSSLTPIKRFLDVLQRVPLVYFCCVCTS